MYTPHDERKTDMHLHRPQMAFINAEWKIPCQFFFIIIFFFFIFMNAFFYNYELIKQLFWMHSQRCDYQHIYKESCPNNFLFSKLTILKATYILWCIKSKTCLFIICCQLLVFPSNSVRICPIKLRFAMLYHMINTFWNIIFLDTCHCALNFAVIS